MSRVQNDPSRQTSPSANSKGMLSYEIRADQIERQFYEDANEPSSDVHIECIVVAEQDQYKFQIFLFRYVDEKNKQVLNWVPATQGEVEVTYFPDAVESRKERLSFQVGQNGDQLIAYFKDAPNLSWEEVLVIGLQFDAHTVKYLNPAPNASQREKVLDIPEMRKVHFEIDDKPEDILKNVYHSRGNPQYDPVFSGSSESSGSGFVTNWLKSNVSGSSERLEFHWTLDWNDKGPLGYRVIFHDLYGDVNGKRMKLNWFEPEKVQVEVIYQTERERFARKKPVQLQKKTDDRGTTTICFGEPLKNMEWKEYIIIVLLFNKGTIKYELPSSSRVRTVQEVQQFGVRFPFSSGGIRGEKHVQDQATS